MPFLQTRHPRHNHSQEGLAALSLSACLAKVAIKKRHNSIFYESSRMSESFNNFNKRNVSITMSVCPRCIDYKYTAF